MSNFRNPLHEKVNDQWLIRPSDITELLHAYDLVRVRSEALAAPLSAEDQMLQAMPDASPTKWHLAHTSWFFETFILKKFLWAYSDFNPAFTMLFNSYYDGIGPQFDRSRRGLLSRPSLNEVMDYRAHVDEGIKRILESANGELFAAIKPLLTLGINHEQQHQELMLTDILSAFALNPDRPAYCETRKAPDYETVGPTMHNVRGGLMKVGHDDNGFCFDNETPAHKVWLDDYRLCRMLVTNGQWMEFMADNGYEHSEHWLADGWQRKEEDGWTAPLYWEKHDGQWHSMSLQGFRSINLNAPVAHISFYEADAFARWAGCRLPTEAEWELAAARAPIEGNLAETGYLRPLMCRTSTNSVPQQLYGDVWEWTQSSYSPYPGYAPASGAVGEYNGKFMVNQMVLRGGSCVTPKGHIRPTYRNFFHPHQRWQFSGLRLAEDASRTSTFSIRTHQDKSDSFLADVLEGLAEPQKRLPSKYFYDEEGSRLFDEICALKEYYIPEAEAPLIREAAAEIENWSPSECVLVEFGSGSSVKTRILLDTISTLTTYVPIDISHDHLQEAASALSARYPSLSILPLACDFTQPFVLPAKARPALGFFPGSTLGNFTPPDAISFLRSARASLGDGRFLVGIDLVKDESQMLAAYNDADGVTAKFNKNILAHINRECCADIDLDCFAHIAIWNDAKSRIEMHLKCVRPTSFVIGKKRISVNVGETIHTENSHKYTVQSFTELAEAAGWHVSRIWTNTDPNYGLALLAT